MNSDFIHHLEDRLSDALGQPVSIRHSGAIGGGCINHASKLQTNAGVFFLKWNASCATDIFLREAEGLRELKKASGGVLKIPDIICVGEIGEFPGFLIQEYLEPGYSNSNDDEKLGMGLAHIHKFSNADFGFSNNNYCGDTIQNNSWKADWIEFYRENRLKYLISLIQMRYDLSYSVLDTFERLISKLEQLIPANTTPSIIHGDLWSGNYMITAQGPALIDPAVYYANREMEFGIITMFGGFSSRFFDAYNHVYALDSDWQDRNPLYQLYHILNHYFLFGGSYLSQAIRVAKRYL